MTEGGCEDILVGARSALSKAAIFPTARTEHSTADYSWIGVLFHTSVGELGHFVKDDAG